jgi:hypothetical protein
MTANSFIAVTNKIVSKSRVEVPARHLGFELILPLLKQVKVNVKSNYNL